MYKILADGRVKEVLKIGLNNYGGNYKILVHQLNNVFVMFNDFDGSKVVEINVDVEDKKAELVRYYKNDDFISEIKSYSVLTSSTGFYLN